MAKNIKDTEIGSEDLPRVASFTDGADDVMSEDLVAVVVLKGHTLYHDGEKYPPTSRVRMSPEDADSLKKRGVVMLYSDLLKQVAGHDD